MKRKYNLTAQQLDFCNHISMGKNPTEAYSMAYKLPKPRSTCTNAGSRLMKHPEVIARVAELNNLNSCISVAANQQALKDVVKYNIASRAECMDILTQIARGELKIEKLVSNKGVPVYKEVTPNYDERRGAIMELNRMRGYTNGDDADFTTITNVMNVYTV
jgi:hypothetical protein